MKPVNLLPEQHRPSRATGKRSGVSYIVLGGLGVVLIAVLAYVLSSNEVTSKQNQAASLAQEAKATQDQVGSLGPVSSFLSIKASREQSVRDLAGRRFDWERMTRELARVLPSGVYVKDLKASVDGQGATLSGPSALATAAATANAPAGPTMEITGCATNQDAVATLLVRLKQLDLAQDALLKESKHVDDSVDGAVQDRSAVGALGLDTPCTAYEFDASVVFDPASVAVTQTVKPDRVPASLGGGK